MRTEERQTLQDETSGWRDPAANGVPSDNDSLSAVLAAGGFAASDGGDGDDDADEGPTADPGGDSDPDANEGFEPKDPSGSD